MAPLSLVASGLVAAFLGTVVMTISQEIEIRLAKRPISYSPAIAVFRILRLDFEKLSVRMKGVASYTVHFCYGTVFGVVLALLYAAGVTSFSDISALYYLIIVIQGWIVISVLGIAGPPWTWGLRPVLTEMFHKAVYTLATAHTFFVLL